MLSRSPHPDCLRKLLRISYLEHKTDDWAENKINFLVDLQEPFLAFIKRRRLAWFGHVTRHDSLSKTILQDTLEGRRRRGRQSKYWMDNNTEWTATRASRRKDWEKISDESPLMLSPPPFPPTIQSVKGLN